MVDQERREISHMTVNIFNAVLNPNVEWNINNIVCQFCFIKMVYVHTLI